MTRLTLRFPSNLQQRRVPAPENAGHWKGGDAASPGLACGAEATGRGRDWPPAHRLARPRPEDSWEFRRSPPPLQSGRPGQSPGSEGRRVCAQTRPRSHRYEPGRCPDPHPRSDPRALARAQTRLESQSLNGRIETSIDRDTHPGANPDLGEEMGGHTGAGGWGPSLRTRGSTSGWTDGWTVENMFRK